MGENIEKRNKRHKVKWIVAGGSYPGNLAAWSRLLYPKLIYGAIASSAPVFAKENFFEYDLQVTSALERHGGQLCAAYFHEVFSLIDKELLSGDPERASKLKVKFDMPDLSNEMFAMNLDFISGLVQYNNPATTNSVAKFCQSLSLRANATKKLDEFADITKRYNFKAKFQSALAKAGDEDLPDEKSMWRQWFYQCCTEFGYWQVAPPLEYSASRSRAATPADWDRLMCSEVYGSRFQHPHTSVTNRHFKGRQNTATRIFWVNGDLDPWRPLSVTNEPHHHPPPYVIYNASHAMDLGNDSKDDWYELAEAKRLAQEYISMWLGKRRHRHYHKAMRKFVVGLTEVKSVLVIMSVLCVVLYQILKSRR